MTKDTDIKKDVLIGSGPVVIGQGSEYDYFCCHGAQAALAGVSEKVEFGRFEVCSLQKYHRNLR